MLEAHPLILFFNVFPLFLEQIQVVYNLSRPAKQRVLSLKILKRGSTSYQEVQNHIVYKVSMTDYMANGGDGFKKLTNVTEAGKLHFFKYDCLCRFCSSLRSCSSPSYGAPEDITLKGWSTNFRPPFYFHSTETEAPETWLSLRLRRDILKTRGSSK